MTMAGMMRAITEIIDQDSIIAEFDDAETLSNTTSTETTMKMMINGNQIVQKGLYCQFIVFWLIHDIYFNIICNNTNKVFITMFGL